jgi:curved DNA-binding protein CbpA
MGTLYDLLGALPDDDAEGLRIAFRRAAKATHPDTNPDNPDAALRFRQLVRAHDILSDAEQRATYDQLLAIATRVPEPPRRAVIYEKMHRFATNTIAATAIAGVLIGGYTFLGPGSPPPAAPESMAQAAEPALAEPAIAVRVVHPVSVRADEPADRRDTATLGQTDIANAVMVTASTPNAPATMRPGPAFLPATADAKTYRERGMFAYRGGDLDRALADFNRAIEQDPGFAAAYIDRGIVFYRMRNFDRAFADMAQAKRLTKPERRKKSVAARPQPPAPVRFGRAPGPRWLMTAAVSP